MERRLDHAEGQASPDQPEAADDRRRLRLHRGDLAGERRGGGFPRRPLATPDGRIYFGSSRRTYVLKAGPKLEVLATNDLDDGNDYTTPAIANGRIYIKGKSYLWCIGAK